MKQNSLPIPVCSFHYKSPQKQIKITTLLKKNNPNRVLFGKARPLLQVYISSVCVCVCVCFLPKNMTLGELLEFTIVTRSATARINAVGCPSCQVLAKVVRISEPAYIFIFKNLPKDHFLKQWLAIKYEG